MKLIVNKNENNNYEMKIDNNGKIINFDYITLIDYLYNNGKIEKIEYNNLNQWEKDEIDKVVKKINELSNPTSGEDDDESIND